MEALFFFAAKLVSVMLEIVSLAMIVRMLLPIFTNPDDSKLYSLTVLLSEPVVAPIRALLVKYNIGQDSPFDWAFFTAYLLIWILQMILPAI